MVRMTLHGYHTWPPTIAEVNREAIKGVGMMGSKADQAVSRKEVQFNMQEDVIKPMEIQR